MRVDYFEDTDTLQVTFKDTIVVDTRDLDEDTLVETDADGQLVSITIEHARDRTDLESFLYRRHAGSAA